MHFWVYDFAKCQRVECTLVVMFRDSANPLQYHPPQEWVLQLMHSMNLLGQELCFRNEQRQ